jgi:hypothetical protein
MGGNRVGIVASPKDVSDVRSVRTIGRAVLNVPYRGIAVRIVFTDGIVTKDVDVAALWPGSVEPEELPLYAPCCREDRRDSAFSAR